MNRPLLAAFALLAYACLVSGPAFTQQKVYQWKDASGRTHYSSSPPASGAYSVRGVVASPPPPAAKPAQPENQQCTQARSNLAILKANANVRIDSDGDGQPDRLMSPEEHATQGKLAESIIATSCKATAKP